MQRIHGQDSFLLKSGSVELAITRLGGHLGPVTFFPDSPRPLQPYAIAPWAEETIPPDTPALIKVLRGDFFCSAFGANAELVRGRKLPLHGETANGVWEPITQREEQSGCWFKLGMDLPLQGGRCEATTAVLKDHSIIYQRHDLMGLTGPINPGHHATLAFPNRQGAGRLSVSRWQLARTYFEPVETAESGGRSRLLADAEIRDLQAAPCVDGSTIDLTSYPGRRGFEDVAMVCADPQVELGWSAVAFPEQRYVWFALRDPRQLTCTLLWFSNGGRDYAPWNGRHVNVMGIEDMTGYFQTGLATSSRANALSARGVPTYLEPGAGGQLSITYIQGVARIPAGFDRVADIQPHRNSRSVRIVSESAIPVDVPCQVDFLTSGRLPGMELS